jgi:DNA-binding transcriptional ArsR family regulator
LKLVDEVFRALADPTRRELLDALFEQDGQSLSALESRFAMSRFGVMKHLRLLEEAGLVVTRRRGRETLHFLNPVPIRGVHDRWVSKYSEPVVAALGSLKSQLEQTMEKIYEIYIRTTPERLWAALTSAEDRPHFQFGNTVRIDRGDGAVAAGPDDWTVGARIEMSNPKAGFVLGSGEVLESTPPHRLVTTMLASWGEDVQAEGVSRITYEIEQVGDSCHLKLTHDQLRDGANEQLYGGWPMILSGLKTWLETGETLTTPGSLMYA